MQEQIINELVEKFSKKGNPAVGNQGNTKLVGNAGGKGKGDGGNAGGNSDGGSKAKPQRGYPQTSGGYNKCMKIFNDAPRCKLLFS